jgi:hypothetical protein
MASILNTGLALPVIREIIDFSKGDAQALLGRLLEQVPQLREVLESLTAKAPTVASAPKEGTQEEASS